MFRSSYSLGIKINRFPSPKVTCVISLTRHYKHRYASQEIIYHVFLESVRVISIMICFYTRGSGWVKLSFYIYMNISTPATALSIYAYLFSHQLGTWCLSFYVLHMRDWFCLGQNNVVNFPFQSPSILSGQ